MRQVQPRASSRLGQVADFETQLASNGSTIRLRGSGDHRDAARDSDNEELEADRSSGSSLTAPTPPRKSASATMATRKNEAAAGPQVNGSASVVRGREAALRDIEREMALDEGEEDSEHTASETETTGGHQASSRTGTALPLHSLASTQVTQRLAGSAPLPSATPPGIDKALPMSPPDLIDADLRRRSQYRSPGLATSPDLATLVKTAKASNGQVASLSPQPFNDLGYPNPSSQLQSNQYAPPVSPVMTVRGTGSPRSRVSSESGSRRPTPVLTTVSSLQAAMEHPRARAVSTRTDSTTSFVHVNSQATQGRSSSYSNGPSVPLQGSTLSTIHDADHGTVTSVSSGGSTTRHKKLTKGGGTDEKSISNAMRKTSGFFRKTFGSKDNASIASTSRPPSTLSVPSTPTSVRFSSYDSSNKPPVPSIPPAYTQTTPTRRPSMETANSSSASPQSGRRPSRSSSQATSSKVSPAKSLGRFSSFAASFRSSDNRSTTDLHNSTSSSSNHASPQRQPASEMKTSTSTVSTEQERLAREIDQWKGYEQGLEILAPENDGLGDASFQTIKARTSTSSGRGPRPSMPSTPPQANRNRSRSNSAAGSGMVYMSGSIPSPQMSSRSPRPSNPDAFFMSGSIPSPQQGQEKFQATDGTPFQGAGLAGSPAMYPTGTRSPSSSSNATNGVRASQDGKILSPTSGKQIRKRSTSASTSPVNSPAVDDERSVKTPTVRLVGTPSSQLQGTLAEKEASAAPPPRKASIGLGLAIEDDPDASSSQPRHRAIDQNLSPVRPNDIPRLVTQSPSPAPPKMVNLTAAYASATPTRTSSSNAAVFASDAALETSTGSLPPDSDTAKALAEKCWNEDESFLKKEKIAEWLGGHGAINRASLNQYMQNFSFKDLSIENAFRRLCEKLYLRAETQQVDRILAAFSARYMDENPDSVFQTKDIVHAATYAMLLLNTDLHVADVSSRMSRSDFILNTMSAIHAQKCFTPPVGARTPASSNSPALHGTNGFFQADSGRASSSEQWRDGAVTTRFRPKRSGSASANSSRTGLNDLSSFTGSSSNLPMQSPSNETPENTEGLLLSSRSDSQPMATGKAWELELESALKEIYNSVRSKAIMQPLAYSQLAPPSGSGSPYSSWNGSVARTPSRRSQGSLAGNDRSVGSKRNSIRGFLGASHESLRATSPTPSAVTSMSGGFSGSTFGSAMSNATSYYPATMGFASNLSHTIIKEQQEDDAQSEMSDQSTSDEELALLGAPWAKEGILQRKHYWETPNKRSKDKHWLQVFAVISKGEMKMFQFGGSGAGSSSSGGMGGGNWLTNAHMVGEVPLAHSLSSAMPPPGYNRSRPHVLVLTLSSGGSYFFQAGTEDLVNEWVLTCNYWAGRTSREPLLGGVSNMDYGWNKVLSGAPQEDTEDLASVRSGRSGHSRISKMSYTASLSRQHGMESAADRANIFDWRPPQPPSGFSTLSEDAQFEALRKHTLALQTELERHNDLRLPMLKLYSPRSVNAGKAAANWEKKSKYLLAELVKYQTYVEALRVARQERQKRRDEKQVNRLLEDADDNAALGDPTYVPGMDDSLDSIVTGDTSRQSTEGDISREEVHSGANTPSQKGDLDEREIEGRQNRFSAATVSTTAEFYEANGARTSAEV